MNAEIYFGVFRARFDDCIMINDPSIRVFDTTIRRERRQEKKINIQDLWYFILNELSTK